MKREQTPVVAVAGLVLGTLVAFSCTSGGGSPQSPSAAVEEQATPLGECEYVRSVAAQLILIDDQFVILGDLIDDDFSEQWLSDWNGALGEIRQVREDSTTLKPSSQLSSLHNDWLAITTQADRVAETLHLDDDDPTFDDPEEIRHAIFEVVPDITDRQLLLLADIAEMFPHCTVPGR